VRGLIPVLLAGLLFVGQPAVAQETGSAPFFCHEAEDALNFAILLDNPDQVDGDALASAGASLIFAGKCVFIPGSAPFVKEDMVKTDAIKNHQVWQVLGPDNKVWYVLHKLEGKPA
jgi:hypothetical protein